MYPYQLTKGGEGRGEGGFKHRLDSLAHALEVVQHFFVAEAYYPQPVAL